MKLKPITQITALRALLKPWRNNNEKIGLVTTMGNLHQGHLALVEKTQPLVDRVIVSIFVNPLQFGPNEDFAAYPRTLTSDIEKLQPYAIDAVFAPSTEEIYPHGVPQTRVDIPSIAQELCGKSRPGHFYGVSTVLSKFFNIVQPDVVIYGEKDFQQLTLVRRMVQELNFPIEVLALPTQRENDGLASSSRNQYLSAEERQIAPKLYATLTDISAAITLGATNYADLCTKAAEQLNEQGFNVDYLEIRDRETLLQPTSKTSALVILVAAFLGKTRLIDNKTTALI